MSQNRNLSHPKWHSLEYSVTIGVDDAKKQRRRANDRINQKRYREIRKAKAAERARDMQLLRDKNNQITIRLALLTDQTLLAPSRFKYLRGSILQMLSDYFMFGLNVHDTEQYFKQKAFASLNFSNRFIMTARSDVPNGSQCFLDQVEMYTILHDHFSCQALKIDAHGDVFHSYYVTSLNISHRTVVALYPHMLSDQEFMDKAIGQHLSIRSKLTFTFSSDNRIVSMESEQALAETWCTLLKDPIKVAKVLQQKYRMH